MEMVKRPEFASPATTFHHDTHMESVNNSSNENIFPGPTTTEEYEEDTPIHQKEPTILEYARFHGLCKDYRLERLLVDRPYFLSDHDFQSDLEDTVGSARADLRSDFTTKERISIGKDSAIFLKSICTAPDLPTDKELASDQRLLVARLKQEVPILRSDNELDLRNFGSTAIQDFRKLKIPLEVARGEQDEGLEWPTKLLALPTEYDKQSKTEKLETSRDVLLFLQTALKDPFNTKDYETIKADALQYKRNPALEPLTPPLLPLTPPLTPFVPSSPAGRLELLSELTDSTAAEARELEDNLISLDAIAYHTRSAGSENSDPVHLEHADIGQFFSPLRGIEESPLTSPRKRKTSDLKVEGPLTPLTNFQSAEKKAKFVSFPEILHEYIPELPSIPDSGDDPLGSQNSFHTFFNVKVAPLAELADTQLENEKLQEFDTTRRVDVPHMEFSLPQAPWAEFIPMTHERNPEGKTNLDFQMKLLVRVKRDAIRDFYPWHGVARLERELQWSPFPAELGSVALDELIQDDEFLYTLLSDLQVTGIVDSSSLTWKRKGLRILDDTDESEDELDVAEFGEEKDLKSLLKRRQMEIEEEEDGQMIQNCMTESNPAPSGADDLQNADNQARRNNKLTISTDASKYIHRQDSSLVFGSLFSASTALSRFMEIHGKANKKPRLAGPSSEPKTLPDHPRTIPLIKPKNQVEINACPREIISSIPATIPLPPLTTNLPPCPFIISATLLRQRYITQGIQKKYPEAELIERDFNLPHSPAEEADLILSPSTGLILTTMQKIKQSALPGQPERSPIKERITSLVERYERLIVFVSEGLAADSVQDTARYVLDNRDSEAFAALVGFSMTLEGEVSVIYLPGGEEALVIWVICAMERWGVSSFGSNDCGEIKLLQDETLWELFLRRAGLNAFAAQAILSSLKSSSSGNDVPDCDSGPQKTQFFGLPAFILMPASERVQRFGILLGGRRILDSVSALLDQCWPSAVNGFAI